MERIEVEHQDLMRRSEARREVEESNRRVKENIIVITVALVIFFFFLFGFATYAFAGESKTVEEAIVAPPITDSFIPNENIPLNADLQEHLYRQCSLWGIDYAFALGTIELESTFKPHATHKNANGTTDRGICQINSSNVKRLKNLGYIKSSDDLYDPYKCVDAGMYMLGVYVAQHGNTEDAYYCYNTGRDTGGSNKASRLVMKYTDKWRSILQGGNDNES